MAPESQNIERKTCSQGRLPDSIWESVTAFSNAEGGYLRLGEEPHGTPTGLSASEADELQRAVQADCANTYTMLVLPDIAVLEHNVVQVYIPPAPAAHKPVVSKTRGIPNGGRVRIGSVNAQLTNQHIQQFAVAARGGAELIGQNVALEIIEKRKVQTYRERVEERRTIDLSHWDESQLFRKFRILDDDGKLTFFGILAFGKSDQVQDALGPTVNISIAQYQGMSKLNTADASSAMLDSREFNGDVIEQYNEAYRFLLSKVPTRSRINAAGIREEYPVIPREAIREALANTLSHRDYTTNASRIQVDIFSDRIEFINPGVSLVPLHELANAPSQTRNPVLMSYLRDMGVAEMQARGIHLILSTAEQAGLLRPEFSHRAGSFVATLFTTSIISEDDIAWLRRFDSFNLTEAQRNILVAARHTPEGVTNSTYRELNRMHGVGDDVRAARALAAMVSIGLLEQTGRFKATRYTLGRNAK